MLRAVATLFLILSSSLTVAQIPPPVIGKAYVVADVSSGQILASEKADERFEPASLTKIMTAYLVFQALRDKKLALDRVVPVSEKAWRASGSRALSTLPAATGWLRRSTRTSRRTSNPHGRSTDFSPPPTSR